jgi:hypothetical protein
MGDVKLAGNLGKAFDRSRCASVVSWLHPMPRACYGRDMKAYLFSSLTDDSICAFSADRTGANLPAALGPWRPISGGASVYIGNDTDFVAQTIESEGFYLLMPEPPETN